MSSNNNTEQQKCKSLLRLPEIRFAGFFDFMRGSLLVNNDLRANQDVQNPCRNL